MFYIKKIFIIIIIILSLFAITSCDYVTKQYVPLAQDVADTYLIEGELVLAVMKVESGFRSGVVSDSGAIGIMQLMPKTAKWICEKSDVTYDEQKLYEAEYNAMLAGWYLKYLLDKFDHNWALAAYNAGEGNVQEWIDEGIAISDIPYAETRGYVNKVNKWYTYYKNKNYFD